MIPAFQDNHLVPKIMKCGDPLYLTIYSANLLNQAKYLEYVVKSPYRGSVFRGSNDHGCFLLSTNCELVLYFFYAVQHNELKVFLKSYLQLDSKQSSKLLLWTIEQKCSNLQKSVNLYYNTLGRWVAWTIVPPSDGPIFQQFLQNSSHNYFHYFYYFKFFYNLKKVKSNYLSTL